MEIATRKLPEDFSADAEQLFSIRTHHYRFVLEHYLNDGTRVIPTVPTVQHIFDAYDQFNLPVAISENSYTVYIVENDT